MWKPTVGYFCPCEKSSLTRYWHPMPIKHRIFPTSVARVYPYYVAKLEKGPRTRSCGPDRRARLIPTTGNWRAG